MTFAFYIAAVLALFATLRVITCRHTMHAILYFIVSLLAVAVIFFLLGAPFAGVLEVILYAGAVMVLFVFTVMLAGGEEAVPARRHLEPRALVLPVLLSLALLVDLLFVLGASETDLLPIASFEQVGPKVVATSLFGPYLIGVELSALLLLVGMLGAYHLGRRTEDSR